MCGGRVSGAAGQAAARIVVIAARKFSFSCVRISLVVVKAERSGRRDDLLPRM